MDGFKSILGEIAWTRPPWLERIGLKRLLLSLLAVAIAAWAVQAIIEYYNSLPKPPRVIAAATAPGVTPIIDGELRPAELYVVFDVVADPRDPVITVDSVANIELIGKTVADGISIEPAIGGDWRWGNENMLVFRPAVDWPAGQTYTVRYDTAIFAPGLIFESNEVSFTTEPFRADVEELTFYQDPVEKNVRKVVATLNFTHPVDEQSLERQLGFTMRESDQTIRSAPKAVARTIDYDKHRRVAYVHSEIIEIPPHENYLSLTLKEGLAPISGPSRTEGDIVDSVLIPDIGSYFRTGGVAALVARDENEKPLQALMLDFTDQVRPQALADKLEVWLLPDDVTMNGQRIDNKRWTSPREITTEVFAQASRLDIAIDPTERESSLVHSAPLDVPEERYLYIKVQQGLESEGGYIMSVPFDTVVRVPRYPREVGIARSGALVPLTGDHKLTFLSRGVDALRVDIGRLIDSEVNHLASQTGGRVETPYFNNYAFNQDNISTRATRYIDLQAGHPRDATYSSLDLSEFLPSGGYFFVDVQGWDRENDRAAGGRDRRLVLVTDLGLLVKTSHDQSNDIFVHSIESGRPIGGATVQLLGKNGIPLFERVTSIDGHAQVPTTQHFDREKTPTVWVVRLGRDSIFMPFNRSDRQLQYSRFDIGGEYVYDYVDAERLKAQVFTDRGIYRPGDTVNLAAIVKSDDWRPLQNLPLEMRIVDARRQPVLQTNVRLPDDGLFDLQFDTTPGSATGDYRATLYLVDEEDQRRSIGQATFKVEEFQPDRLKIRSSISGQKPRGWLKPGDLYAEVSLENLFGTPAQSRRVTGELTLSPSRISFSDYPGYRFVDPLRDPSTLSTVRRTLTETLTDDDGNARLPLTVAQYDKGIYTLTVTTEGFEEGGGRSVRSRASVMMSPLDTLLGYKTPSNLDWLDRDSEHVVDLLALDSDAQPVALDGLTLRIEAQRYVSTLVRRPNGTYAYQSTLKTEIVGEQDLDVAASGSELPIPTGEPGTFALVIVDKGGLAYSRIRYTVAGARNLAGNLERDAELELTLNGESFDTGGEIEMQITAPYTGAGLITIERDRVYAWKWFRADTNTTVQTIRVPEGVEGNAYVNVAFVRDLDSPEIFVSPLSYAVEPFAIDRSARTIDIDIAAPELARPGTSLDIDYTASSDAKIIVYAVDEGILQVANYSAPRPIEFFLPKMALQVGTWQMVDLLLPQFEAFIRAAAPGGGEAAGLVGQNLNPFRRKAEPPVAFWSGVIDAGPDSRRVSFDVPDYFNGRLRIMAVAVSNAAVGRHVDGATIRGPFVITPNLLTAAAPGDEFDVTVGVANSLEGSGDDLSIGLEAVASEHIEIVGDRTASLVISEGSEDRARFRVRALDTFGNATLVFTASGGDEQVRRGATLSVRPSVAYVATALSASTTDDPTSIEIRRRLHPQFARQSVAASTSPFVLADGMLDYLEVFPHLCTEQIVSKVFPQLGFLDSGDSTVDTSKIRESFETAIRSLRTRQLPGGGFRFWPSANEPATFPSIYLLHFLSDARELHLAVPPAMLNAGLDYARRVAGNSVSTIADARVRAYAIYVLTRNGHVTTNYLTNLHESLERLHKDEWQSDLAAVYMAASYALLQQDALGRQLIRDYEYGGGDEMTSDFDTRLGRDSQYLYLLARHFPGRLETVDASRIEKLVDPIMRNRFNTLSASYAISALRAYTNAINAGGKATLTVDGIAGDTTSTLATAAGTVRASFEEHYDALRLSGNGDLPAFYVVSQTGYDAEPPQDAAANGLELFREYLDDNGRPVTRAKIGDELTVRLRVRSTGLRRSNVAVVDLLPGGFEVMLDSIRNDYGRWYPDYKDIREDRVVIYGSFGDRVTEINYRVKVTAAGSFVVPSAFAGSMYDREIEARTAPGRFEVEQAQ